MLNNKNALAEFWAIIVLALIFGALLIGYIVPKIVVNIKSSSERRTSVVQLSALGNVFASLSISSETYHEGTDLPKEPIQFTCDNYSIGEISRAIGNKIIYSPNLLKGER